ncbi:ABC transporter permease subunit [Nitrosomonas communis]|uniref:Polar amino acid transport system substrate-binding protein n=1 Tax=Nitrosomonas communis TaxID=44574 RepID=A0A1I4Q2P9_9PROT|nr:ABC transporter permease subunit [Nitrosomonas communis]SFM34136.1 polar amino acid transport system substrate-binding protein [Nitrosomonas communis]
MKIPALLALIILVAFAPLAGCKKSEIVITRLDQAKNARIGVMTGSTGEAITRARFPQAQVKSFDDIMDAVAAMNSGQLDTIVTAYPAALQVSKKNPELGLLAEPLAYEDTAIALKKGNDELLSTLNRIISELKSDGTLESMKKRWFKLDLSPYEEINITLPIEGKPLKIGVSATREPFSFVDKNGRVTGHDGELARIIGVKLQRPVEFYNMKFMALIPALQSGKVDLIVTGMTATEERRKFVDFTQPYYANAQVMLVRETPTAKTQPLLATGSKLTTVTNLKNKRIAVLVGSAHDIYATKNYPDATILQYKSPADVALAVKSGKVDAALYDAEPLREIMRQDDSFGLLGDPLFTFPIGVGFNKDIETLRDQFNQFLSEIKQSGIYHDMIHRWMEQGETHMPIIENIKPDGVLIAGISDAGLPFTAVKDNQLVGFDIELLERFAAYLGKELKLANMDFGSLIAAVSTGKVDMIASAIYVTEERKKQINFSEPYYEIGTRVFALKKNILNVSQAGFDQVKQKKITSVTDLQDKRIGVLLGSVHDTYAMEHYPNATILQYKNLSDLLLAVKSGKVDAAIYNRESLVEILSKDSELGPVGALLSYPIGIGFNKDNDALRAKFNEFLQRIKSDGLYNDMVYRWVEKGDIHMPEIVNPKLNGTLVVGIVSDKGLPFTVLKENKLIGFDIELAKRFAAYLRKEVKFADMDFGSLIAAVSSGKVDMIASTLYITEERKKQIDFSDPYYEIATEVFALKRNISDYDIESTPVIEPPTFLTGIISSFYSNIIQEDRYLLIWDGLKTTVIISIFSTILGTLLGASVCFMRMSHRTILNLPAKVYINLIRGMPVLILLMLIFYVVFASVSINPVLVAIIAFGMNFAAYVSEIFRSGIEGVNRGQIEAGIAMGFTKFKTFVFIVLPQTVQRILPVYKGEFISLVKMTSIVGYIAVQDLTKASDIIRSRTFDAFFPLIMVSILYFLIAWLLMQSLGYLERVTDPRYKRRKAVKA